MSKKQSNIHGLLSKGHIVPTKEKIYFSFGVLANTILAGIVSLYLTDYYLNEIKITYQLFILANFIFLFWNALNDIVFAYYADRTKHRLGRRIPYIRYGAPFFALSFIYFWFPLPGTFPGSLSQGQGFKFFQLLTALLFFDTMLTIVILSIVALPPEMTESTEERASIALYNTIFGAIGGISIVLVPTIMSLGLDIFRGFVIIMGCVATISYLILSYGVKERKELHEGSEEKEKEFTIIKEMTQSLKNRTFVSFLMFNFCVVFINTMLLAFVPYFTNIVGMHRDQATLILIIGFIGNGLSLPVYIHFTKKIAIRTIIIRTALICMTALLILFVVDLLFSISEIFYAVIIIDGILLGMNFFYYPFISDAIDIDELNTERRREGIHFGMNALITKPAEQLAPITGAFILLITGYVQGGTVSQQPVLAISGLKFMATIIPVILCSVIILSQLINPSHGEYLSQMKQEIIKRHAEKEKIIK